MGSTTPHPYFSLKNFKMLAKSYQGLKEGTNMNIFIGLSVVITIIVIAIIKNEKASIQRSQQQNEIIEFKKSCQIVKLMHKESNLVHPNRETMKLIVSHDYKANYYPPLLEAYEIKLESEKIAQNTTLSPLQLYKDGNPSWAKHLAPCQIVQIINHKNEPNFETVFNATLKETVS